MKVIPILKTSVFGVLLAVAGCLWADTPDNGDLVDGLSNKTSHGTAAKDSLEKNTNNSAQSLGEPGVGGHGSGHGAGKVNFAPVTVKNPKGKAHSNQTAVVEGEDSDETHVDGHGRVKVKFNWDQNGKNDGGDPKVHSVEGIKHETDTQDYQGKGAVSKGHHPSSENFGKTKTDQNSLGNGSFGGGYGGGVTTHLSGRDKAQLTNQFTGGVKPAVGKNSNTLQKADAGFAKANGFQKTNGFQKNPALKPGKVPGLGAAPPGAPNSAGGAAQAGPGGGPH